MHRRVRNCRWPRSMKRGLTRLTRMIIQTPAARGWKRILETLDISRAGSVIDVGCGKGRGNDQAGALFWAGRRVGVVGSVDPYRARKPPQGGGHFDVEAAEIRAANALPHMGSVREKLTAVSRQESSR